MIQSNLAGLRKFSAVWKNNFHGVEKMGLVKGAAAKIFHGVEKFFP